MDGQARNLLTVLGERAGRFTFLIRDGDRRFTAAVGGVFCGHSTRVICTSALGPRANSCAGTVHRYAAP